jgi:putative endonuclease
MFVYVLYSPEYQRYYIGSTEDLDKRLLHHNSGKVRSTKAFRPWKRVYQEQLENRSEAMKREKYLKSGYRRAWLKRQGILL